MTFGIAIGVFVFSVTAALVIGLKLGREAGRVASHRR